MTSQFVRYAWTYGVHVDRHGKLCRWSGRTAPGDVRRCPDRHEIVRSNGRYRVYEED